MGIFKRIDSATDKIISGLFGSKKPVKKRRSLKLTKKQQQIQSAKIRRVSRISRRKGFQAGVNYARNSKK